MDPALRVKVEARFSRCLCQLGLSSLSNEQVQALSFVMDRVDAIIVLPTGSGKSVVFQLAPFYCSSK